MRFPNTAHELVAALDTMFPEVTAMPGDDPQVVMQAAMQRSVVQFLKQWRDGADKEPPRPRQRGQGRRVHRINPQGE